MNQTLQRERLNTRWGEKALSSATEKPMLVWDLFLMLFELFAIQFQLGFFDESLQCDLNHYYFVNVTDENWLIYIYYAHSMHTTGWVCEIKVRTHRVIFYNFMLWFYTLPIKYV